MSLALHDPQPWRPRIFRPKPLRPVEDAHIQVFRHQAGRDFKSLARGVTAETAITLESMRSEQSLPAVIAARQLLQYRLAKNTTMSTSRIGQLTGQTHTTVIRGIRKHCARNSLPMPRGMKEGK